MPQVFHFAEGTLEQTLVNPSYEPVIPPLGTYKILEKGRGRPLSFSCQFNILTSKVIFLNVKPSFITTISLKKKEYFNKKVRRIKLQNKM